MRNATFMIALLSAGFVSGPTLAQQDAEHLAKQLSNPIAALISLPFQLNYDERFGPSREGHRWTLNVQPVIPITLNQDWNVISRTIVPIVDQKIPGIGDGSQDGFGDITQSLFFSPKKPTAGGLIWGAGPVFLIPSDTDNISAKKWGLGPTGVVLKQDGPWTYGALANHIWSVGGSGPQSISSTFFQPFLAHTTKTATTITLQAESTYDWNSSQWTIPIGLFVSQVLRVGGQPLSIQAGPRYYADSAPGGPHGWGFRVNLTLMFPK